MPCNGPRRGSLSWPRASRGARERPLPRERAPPAHAPVVLTSRRRSPLKRSEAKAATTSPWVAAMSWSRARRVSGWSRDLVKLAA